MATDKEAATYLKRELKLRQWFLQGERPQKDILDLFQAVFNSKSLAIPTVAVQTPGWYVPAEERLSWLIKLNGKKKLGFAKSDFPTSVPEFVPVTPTEVLLLAAYLPDKGRVKGVQRTFDLWHEVAAEAQAEVGKGFWRNPELKSDPAHLRLLEGIEHRPGVRWVGFDPYANWVPNGGRSVRNVRGTDSAGPEVLMGLAQFPRQPHGWNGTTDPHQDMAGYEYRPNADDEAPDAWYQCPYASWHGRKVDVRSSNVGHVSQDWAAPRVRKL